MQPKSFPFGKSREQRINGHYSFVLHGNEIMLPKGPVRIRNQPLFRSDCADLVCPFLPDLTEPDIVFRIGTLKKPAAPRYSAGTRRYKQEKSKNGC